MPKAREKIPELEKLGLHFGLEFEGMVGYPVGGAVVKLPFEPQDLSSKIEVL